MQGMRLSGGPQVIALGVALAACSSGTPQSTPTPPKTAPAAPATTSTAALPKTAAPGATLPPGATATPAGPKAIPLLPTPFHVVAQARDLRFRMLVSGDRFLMVGDHLQAELDGDTLVRSARLGRGLPTSHVEVFRLVGEFPEPLVLTLSETRIESRGRIATYRFQKDRWKRMNPSDGGTARWFCAWHGPRGELGMVKSNGFDPWPGSASAKLPRMPPPATLEFEDPAAIYVLDARCFPDGHVIALGVGPDEEPEPLRLAVWKPGDELPTAIPAPIIPGCVKSDFCRVNVAWLAARGPRDVWVLALASPDPKRGLLPFLARFDGAAWVQIDVPRAEDGWHIEHAHLLQPLAIDDAGTLWMIRPVFVPDDPLGGDQPKSVPGSGTNHEIWRRSPDTTWVRVNVPDVPGDPRDAVIPQAVVVRGKDDVWVAAHGGVVPRQSFLLRTKAQPAVTLTSAPKEAAGSPVAAGGSR